MTFEISYWRRVFRASVDKDYISLSLGAKGANKLAAYLRKLLGKTDHVKPHAFMWRSDFLCSKKAYLEKI